MAGKRWICNQCGEKCDDLCFHIVKNHLDLVKATGGDKEKIQETFGISKWTADRLWKLSGLFKCHAKVCPRCGKEYNTNQIDHLVQEHCMVLCAAKRIGLNGHEIARMFFGGWIKNNVVNSALKIIEEQEIVDLDDIMDLPKLGIVLRVDKGQLRPMKKEETGFGVIYADESLSF